MKYSDIIGLHDNFLPFVDLQNEKSDFCWKQFIPVSQFLNLLNKTVDSVASCQSICRNSIWVKGTYGTGKSHAGSVVKHLLCDDMNEIVDYLHILPPEYKEKLLHFRKSKRLFPVVLKGLENGCIHDMRSFLLTLERIIKDSLRNAGHDNIAVKSNFERAIAFLESTPINIDEIIANEPKLRSYAKSKEGIIKKLHISDVDVYFAVEEALAKPQYSIRFTVSDDLIKWLSEVEKEIASKSIADGLLVIWDEFTSVMDTIPNGMTNMIQNIAELTKKQNIYLYLISHRNSKTYHDDADISKMESRFHLIRYDMEAPTTYRIMSESIKKLDAEQYDLCRRSRMDNLSELIAYLTENDSQQSIRDIKDLFPFHPYSSYLCSTIANQIGSAQRTIMQFMHDRQSGFLGFLDDENNYDKGLLLTADKLWDYFLKEFQDDSEKFGIVNQTFYTHKKTVENKGSSFEKVFKGILLLNAMCKKIGEADKIVPSRQNIKYLFDGENFDVSTIDEMLDYFHKNQIVNRDPSDNFLIAFSALPVNEINDAINRAKSIFSDAKKILDFDSLYFKGKINEIFEESLIRQPSLAYLACFPDDCLVRSQIKSTFKESSYKLNIALFFAMDNTEYQAMTKIVKDFSAKEDCNNMIFLMFDEIFDYDGTQRRSFYEYVATAEIAGKRHNKTSEKTNSENAKKIIINWIDRLKQGMAKIYFRGEQNTINTSTVTKPINDHYCGKIFSNGVETLSSLKKSPMTFWKTFKNPSKASIEPILAATDRDNAEDQFKGQYAPAKLLFKDDNDDYIVDADLVLKPNAPENHPLVQMQKKVDEIFENIKRRGGGCFYIQFGASATTTYTATIWTIFHYS